MGALVFAALSAGLTSNWAAVAQAQPAPAPPPSAVPAVPDAGAPPVVGPLPEPAPLDPEAPAPSGPTAGRAAEASDAVERDLATPEALREPPQQEPAAAGEALRWIVRLEGGGVLPPAGFGAVTIGASPTSWLWFEFTSGGSSWGFQNAIFLRAEPLSADVEGVHLAASFDAGISSINGPSGWYVEGQFELALTLLDTSGFALLAGAGEPLAITGNAVDGLSRCVPPCGGSGQCVVPFPPTCGFGMPYGRLGVGYSW